jgi:hypothetical protein
VSLSPKSSLADVRRHLDELERELQARPLAKTNADPRAEARCTVHAAFVAAIDHLEELGWSRGRIARYIGVELTTLSGWYDDGDKRRSQLPFWVLRRLPVEARAIVMRAILDWSEPPPSAGAGADAA